MTRFHPSFRNATQRLLAKLLVVGLLFLLQLGTTTTLHAAEDDISGTTFTIVSQTPTASDFQGVDLATTIQATFSDDVDTNTLANNFYVQSDQQGKVAGAFAYEPGTRTVTFTPAQSFRIGELVTVIATASIRSSGGTALTPTQWRFSPGVIDPARCVEGFLGYTDDFTAVWASATDWGDYDLDGDLDAVVVGKTAGNEASFVYRNDGVDEETGMSAFTRRNIGMSNVRDASVEWGDYDNDGYPDILLTGADVFGQKVSHIYHNNQDSTFTNIGAQFTPVSLGGATWVDYNNDGRLDVFLHGDGSGGRLTRLYRNDGGNIFTQVALSLPGVNNSAVDWADYDKDGDPDLLLTGDAITGFITEIYRNDNGTFTAIGASLPGVRDSAVAWGDYNDDGLEDILLSGETSSGASAPITRIYRNNGNGTFTDINAGLTGILDGSVAWGDFDNDGDLDVLVGGKDAAEEVSTTLYENRGGSFVVFPTTLPAISLGSLTFGDADNDLDVDILLTGLTDDSIVAGVYRNYDCPADVAITQELIPSYTTNSEAVTITLDFTNLGPVTATEVAILDIVPASFSELQVISTTTASHIQITDSGADPPYRWNVSNLEVGDGGTITVTGLLLPRPGQVYTNTARIYSAEDITLTNNTAVKTLVVPVEVVQTKPALNRKVNVPRNQQFELALNAIIDVDTVEDKSLRVYGSQSGLLGKINATYSVGAQAYRFSADRPFVHGETITVIAADTIRSFANAPLVPYQWQFVAAESSNRCVGDFARRGIGLPGVEAGDFAWGDYDKDGDSDFVIAGQSAQGIITRLYRNNGDGSFSDVGAPLTGVRDGTVDWVDYDADGDLDLFLSGSDGATRVARLYRNTTGTFSQVNSGITPVASSASAWGDYDNDGNLDLLLAGDSAGGRVTQLFRNNGDGTFANINAGLQGVTDGSVAWGDYDDDHDLDLVVTGNNGGGPFAILYRNDNGTFVDSGTILTSVEKSAVAWADYDNDGDFDLLVTGRNGANHNTTLYRNNGGTLASVATSLPNLSDGSVAWGDYDNDGTLDLALSGTTDSGPLTAIYRVASGAFTLYGGTFISVQSSAIGWGDYDNDLDLDLLYLGNNGASATTQLYRNTDCISDVAITKVADPTVIDGSGTVTYTIRFSNTGPQPALNVNISDLLAEDVTNLQVVSTTIGVDVEIVEAAGDATRQWLVSDLQVGEGGIITMTGTVQPGAPGTVFNNEVSIFAKHDITLTNNSAVVPVARPFHITSTSPAHASVDVPRNSTISAGFDAAVNPASASAQTVTIYGSQSGLREVSVGYSSLGQMLYLTPTVPFYYGEAVNVVGTQGLRSVPGAPLAPYQWHFTAGTVDPERCLAGFDARNTPIPALRKSSAAWGDYDGDNDLDLLLTGTANSSTPTTKLYRNDGNNVFVDVAAPLTAIHSGAAAWGDYDKDGDLDIALAGSSGSGPVTQIYRNDNGTFVNSGATLTGVTSSDITWADANNDGLLDLFVLGTADGTNGLTRLYHNLGNGTFTAQSTSLVNLYRGSAAWGDDDGDGDLDLLITGTTDGSTVVTKLYRNDGASNFVDAGVTLPGIQSGDAIWGDQDNDGDLDIFLVGQSTGGARIAKLYRNNGSEIFEDITGSIGFPTVDQATAVWGDYDNDGDLDLLISGTTDGSSAVTQVMLNQGANSYRAETAFNFAGIYDGTATWSDYDNDGDLDIFVAGVGATGNLRTLYQSRDCVSNLGMVKSASATTVLPGELVTYTLAINNTGPQQATKVVITDLIPVNLLSNLSVQSTLAFTQVNGAPYVLQLPNIQPGQGGTVTIKGRPTFAATGATITNTASVYAREDITPTNDVDSVVINVRAPLANFSLTEQSIDESGGSATVVVTLDVPNFAGDVTVTYQATAGIVARNSSYSAFGSTQLIIPAGQTSASFTIPITDDQLDEDDETLQLTLTNVVGAKLGNVTVQTLTIIDNDPLPTASANSLNVAEESGVANFVFTLNTVSGRDVTLVINTVNGTATAPDDFVALVDKAFVIPAGSTSVTVPVTLVDNAKKEGPEQFSLAVTPTNANLASGQITATLTDNDEYNLYLPIVNR